MLCASCGLDNDPSAAFCARCNATLGKQAPAPVPPPWVPPSSGAQQPPRDPQVPPPWSPPAPSVSSAPPSSAAPSNGDDPTYILAPEPRRRTPSLPLVAVGVALLVLVTSIGVFLVSRDREPDDDILAGPGPATTAATEPAATDATTPATDPATPPATESTASAQEQAAVIDGLLDRSVASRRKLNTAIDQVRRCSDVPGALDAMREVGVERGQQISDAGAADLSALSNGETLRSALSTALGHSLDADEHFVGWAQPAAGGDCGDSSAREAAWARGQSSSKLAQAAKKQFLAAWNPVAVPLGYASRSNLDI